jgi:hypothetical protein
VGAAAPPSLSIGWICPRQGVIAAGAHALDPATPAQGAGVAADGAGAPHLALAAHGQGKGSPLALSLRLSRLEETNVARIPRHLQNKIHESINETKYPISISTSSF